MKRKRAILDVSWRMSCQDCTQTRDWGAAKLNARLHATRHAQRYAGHTALVIRSEVVTKSLWNSVPLELDEPPF